MQTADAANEMPVSWRYELSCSLLSAETPVFRVTTFLENLEMTGICSCQGNVRELAFVRQLSGKKSCQGKLLQCMGI